MLSIEFVDNFVMTYIMSMMSVVKIVQEYSLFFFVDELIAIS